MINIFLGDYDSVRTYMAQREVPEYLTMKVARWFDYAWRSRSYGDDGSALRCLPDKIKAEISIQVSIN